MRRVGCLSAHECDRVQLNSYHDMSRSTSREPSSSFWPVCCQRLFGSGDGCYTSEVLFSLVSERLV
jgi:hypothetical protein